VAENKTLSVEHSHLADLMANVQRMHGDLERAGENDRRRLESQIQMMEGQTCVSESPRSYLKLINHNRQDLKAQLSQERDAVRHVTLQKDIDLKDLQTRLDRTVSTASVKITLSTYALQTGQLSQAWESLVGAETSKAHLQECVDQLTHQLQGNEEKLAMYERRTAGISGAAPAVEQDLPREQQLKQEVAELQLVSKDCLWCSTKQIDVRSALKVAQV